LQLSQVGAVRDARPFTPSPRAKSGKPDFAIINDRSRIDPTSAGEGRDEGGRAERYGIIVAPSPQPSPPWGEGAKRRARLTFALAFATVLLVAGPQIAVAQDLGTLDAKPLPPLANPNDPNNPAKELFGRKTEPALLRSEAIGFYAKGCLAGAEALPINGPTWQVMRLSRNRNWGHPSLIQFIERLSERGAKVGWPGLLIGDMAQPRGGPMITGHASHQIGLDADIWLRPMPNRLLTPQEREEMSATMVVADSRKDVDPNVWTPAHAAIIKAAAQDPLVERIFVNAAIKKALCQGAGTDRAWLQKVRPYWDHDYHFHVRIKCPQDSASCRHQDPVPPGDGCGKELDWWFTDAVLHPKPSAEPEKPRFYIKMADLPPACRQVLAAP
jgi:penicillin-insensitive murein endopeptidase